MVSKQYKIYSDEADSLSKGTPTPQTRERLKFLLSAMATMREFNMHEEAEAVVRAASQSASAFRARFFSEEATRSYVPLSESTGASLIPGDFEVQLKQAMVADGPLFAGSPLITSMYVKTMTGTKIAVNADSNAGSIAVENVGFPTDDAELTGLSGVTIGNTSKNFSSGIVLASTSLAADAPTFEQTILKAVSPRLSRIQNLTILGLLKTALALNSSAAVAAAGSTIAADDAYTLASAVGSQYRASSQAAWIMSPAKQTALGALKTSSGGQREFPNVLASEPSLLGFPVHIIAQASDDDIFLGDWSYLYSKSTPVLMKILQERFVVQGFYGFLLSERVDVAWAASENADCPVKYLTFA